MPSLTEAFGVAILEAMAAGLPVVATSVGGIPEIIRDRQNGRLVPAQDPAALAQTLSEILAQPALQEELRLEGLKTAHQFAVKRMMEETYKVYARVMAGQP